MNYRLLRKPRDNILLCKIYQELQSSTSRPKLGKYCMYRLLPQLLFKIAFFRNFSVKSLSFFSLIKFPLKLKSNVSNPSLKLHVGSNGIVTSQTMAFVLLMELLFSITCHLGIELFLDWLVTLTNKDFLRLSAVAPFP